MSAAPPPPASFSQLALIRVPLEEVAQAFAQRDANGRIPVIATPRFASRIRNDFVLAGVAVLAAGVILILLFFSAWYIPLVVAAGLGLIAFGVYRSFMVKVPEGAQALLARGGRYQSTIGSGTHVVPPWVAVSHIVTQREIPFDVPVVAAPTKDTVRVVVDSLLTFTIVDPYRFVFTISTDDFDQVLQASCQEAIRARVRQISVAEVLDLTVEDGAALRDVISPDVEQYGVQIMRVKITFVQPPESFLQSEEGRQLSVIQRAEQAERQALAERRQADEDELARRRLLARVQREQDEFQIQVQRAEDNKQLVELQAESEALRFQRLEERLRLYPAAAAYDNEVERLEVARALAGNTRAVLQIGNATEIGNVLVMRSLALESDAVAPPNGAAAVPSELAPDALGAGSDPEQPD